MNANIKTILSDKRIIAIIIFCIILIAILIFQIIETGKKINTFQELNKIEKTSEINFNHNNYIFKH